MWNTFSNKSFLSEHLEESIEGQVLRLNGNLFKSLCPIITGELNRVLPFWSRYVKISTMSRIITVCLVIGFEEPQVTIYKNKNLKNIKT